MIPFANDVVTLYHYTGKDTWTRRVLSGVYWRYGATTMSGSQNVDGRNGRTSQTQIIIPGALLTATDIDVGGKDYFVLGDCPDITSNYSPADLKREHPELGVVKSVEDRTHAPHLKHWKVILE